MACIKGVSRSASVAIAPDAPYLAAGTMAGAVDLSFSSSANIEIFMLDFQSDDRELPVVGGCTSSERFNRLSWGKNLSESEEFALGLIAGSFVDGTIGLWNPSHLINSDAGETAFVAKLSKHKGAVRGLEFNTHSPNLLASGGDEGEICIWDLVKPTEPSHFPTLKGSGSASQGEIPFLSWNSKVQHILASTSYNGTTVVWDLKKQKPAISFSDSSRKRCSVLQWNPDVATQLTVACDDDNSPSLKLWDMRNMMTPVREFVGHTKGVIAMSWCPTDSSYLLTCAKDNRTICWDTNTAEIVCELPAGTNWNFDIHWYPKIPGVISASSFDGKIGIYNVEGCSRYGFGETDFCGASLRAPKWYRRQSGVSFGFGGKLVSFQFRTSAAGVIAGTSEVYVHDLVAEDGLVTRSTEFERAVQNGEKSSLRDLCDKKSCESESGDEKETWSFLKVMFEEEGTARTKLLSHLGFSVPVEEKESEDSLSQQINALKLDENVAPIGEYRGDMGTGIFPTDNGEDFFNNLPSPKADTPLSVSGKNFSIEDDTHCDERAHETDGADASFEEIIQRALVVGDYKGAVQHCILANKMADALVIAHVGGTSLWEHTRDQYLKTSQSSYLQVVAAMVNNDLIKIVKTKSLKSWKEILALICTFARGEEWTGLCDTLASRLVQAGNILPATLCYICAGNIDSTVEIWSQSLSAGKNGKSYVNQLQDLMEKTIVLALATGQKQFSSSLHKLVEKYTEILASQGLLTTAMEYLKILGLENSCPELMILHDRIALFTQPDPKQLDNNSGQSHAAAPYGMEQATFGGVQTPQPYYQETSQTVAQGNVPGSPYGQQYQQPFATATSYNRDYNTPYQAPSQPHMFMPSQPPPASHIPQANFAPPPPVTAQPTVRPFVPATPPVLKNADQYQQPTLGSQLYPLAAPTGAHFSSLRAPQTPAVRGFAPVSGAVSTMQPPSPRNAAPVQTPSAPPPTVQTVDTSKVPEHKLPVIATLKKLFNETTDALGGPRAVPAKKREIDDNSRKIGALFVKLNSGDISKNAADKLVQLCQALDKGDYTTALQIQVLLTTSEWDECNFWLATLKRMIRTRQSMR